MSTPMDDLHTASQAAYANLEAQRARLLRPDGNKVYGDEEHAYRERSLLVDFNTQIAGLQAQAEKRVTDAQAAAASLQADPTANLSVDELLAANQRAAFVEHEAEGLPVNQLLTRCREAIAAGDKAGILLWSRNAASRVRAFEEQARELDLRTPDGNTSGLSAARLQAYQRSRH
jgi:prophage tail gpP-like protein